MVESIRLSIGTAALLGLVKCKLDAKPTTAYTMTYTSSRCNANCAFCSQARGSNAKAHQLSRVGWPAYPLSQVIDTLTQRTQRLPFERLCIQTLLYPNLIKDLTHIVNVLKYHIPEVPISLALPPLEAYLVQNLYEAGVDRVAISLDAVTSHLFDAIKGSGVKGPFTWNRHFKALETVRAIFGPNRTTTHLIIGLGETEAQTVNLMEQLFKKGINIGLFPFTPITGTSLANKNRPTLDQYRRIQLAHYLLQNQLITTDQIQFNAMNKIEDYGLSNETLRDIIARGKAFQTAGCPSCNRPFFTEQPGGPIYNYPTRPSDEALREIEHQLAGVL